MFKSWVRPVLFICLLAFIYAVIAVHFTTKALYPHSYVPSVIRKSRFFGIIDAGSSGSRIFVYERCLAHPTCLTFSHSSDGEMLSHKVTPGLSTYTNNPSGAVKHVMELLIWLENHVSREDVPKTSIHLLATAGMRLLPEKARNDILITLNTVMPKKTQFVFEKAEVITGVDEGLFQWLATNYMAGLFPHKELACEGCLLKLTKEVVRTKGIIEVGGGSLQIAFEVTKQGNYIFNYYNYHTQNIMPARLYVKSLLGYGMNSIMQWYFTDKDNSEYNKEVCLPKSCKYKASFINSVSFDVVGRGEFKNCMSKLTEWMLKSGRIHFDLNTNRKKLLGLDIDIPSGIEFEGYSEYYYSSHDVLNYTENWNSDEYFNKNEIFCKREFIITNMMLHEGFFNTRDENILKTQCFRGAYLLVIGNILFGKGHRILPLFQREGKEIQWTLGSLVYKDIKRN